MNLQDTPAWLLARGDHAILRLSVQPGARHSELVGVHDGTLRLRVAAPAVEGRANQALCAWLAGQLGCPRRDVQLLRGESSRHKQVAVTGSPERVRACLQAMLDQATTPAQGAAPPHPKRAQR